MPYWLGLNSHCVGFSCCNLLMLLNRIYLPIWLNSCVGFPGLWELRSSSRMVFPPLSERAHSKGAFKGFLKVHPVSVMSSSRGT